MASKFWDDRYAEAGLAYGEEPNHFLRKIIEEGKLNLPSSSSILCLAEGEGRNAFFLAQNDARVTAMDFSQVAVEKMQQTAAEKNLKIHVEQGDLSNYDLLTSCPDENGWNLVVSIFGHTPPAIRQRVHSCMAAALKPGGYYLVVGYTPNNVGRGTGGPQDPLMCLTRDNLLEELVGLEAVSVEEVEERVDEGKYHQGLSSVVHAIFRRSL